MLSSLWIYLQSLSIPLIGTCSAILTACWFTKKRLTTWLSDQHFVLEQELSRTQRIIFTSNFLGLICIWIVLLHLNKWFSLEKSAISNFNSLFEISIGLNIIFYIFTLLPDFEKSLRKTIKAAAKQEEEIVKLGGQKTTYAFGNHLADNFRSHVRLGKLVCWAGTIAASFWLLVSGFYPLLELYNFLILTIILLVIAPTTISALNIRKVKIWANGFVRKRRRYRDHLAFGAPYAPEKEPVRYAEIDDYIRVLKKVSEDLAPIRPSADKPQP